MLNIMVFALVLVGAQILGGIVVMFILMSKPFMKWYVKKVKHMTKDLQEFYVDLFEELG